MATLTAGQSQALLLQPSDKYTVAVGANTEAYIDLGAGTDGSGYDSVRLTSEGTNKYTIGEYGRVAKVTIRCVVGYVNYEYGDAGGGGGGVAVTFGVIGDSRAAENGYFGRTLDAKGAAAWVSILSGGSLQIDPANIRGIGGTMIAENNASGLSALNRLTELSGKGLDVIFTFCDINDAIANRTGEQMFADKMKLNDAIIAMGALPVHCVCVVPDTLSPTAPAKKEIAKYNRLLSERAQKDKSFVLIDTDLRYVDWVTGGSIGGATTTSPYYDGLHYGPLAARAIGKDAVDALKLRGLLPNPAPFLMTGPMDKYSADAPYGNRFGDVGKLSGTGGALRDNDNNSASAATGVVADGCRLYKGVGNAVAVVGVKSTQVVRGATVTSQKITITAGGTGNQYVSFELPNASNYAAGESYELGAFINFKKAVGLQELGFFCAEYSAPDYNVNQVLSNFGDGASSLILQEPLQAEIRVPRIRLSSNPTALQSRITMRVDGATADIELEIALPTLRLVQQ